VDTIEMVDMIAAWILLIALVATPLALDLGVFHRSATSGVFGKPWGGRTFG